ncbi:hypothetical protein EZS27_018652 [termite gut metagenome]|uniref:Uncharacterized protein n=1 Tax=termite gut metagenome TaxID=433724 RepID=A0A5J4RFS9_9ZZZZ
MFDEYQFCKNFWRFSYENTLENYITFDDSILECLRLEQKDK